MNTKLCISVDESKDLIIRKAEKLVKALEGYAYALPTSESLEALEDLEQSLEEHETLKRMIREDEEADAKGAAIDEAEYRMEDR